MIRAWNTHLLNSKNETIISKSTYQNIQHISSDSSVDILHVCYSLFISRLCGIDVSQREMILMVNFRSSVGHPKTQNFVYTKQNDPWSIARCTSYTALWRGPASKNQPYAYSKNILHMVFCVVFVWWATNQTNQLIEETKHSKQKLPNYFTEMCLL